MKKGEFKLRDIWGKIWRKEVIFLFLAVSVLFMIFSVIGKIPTDAALDEHITAQSAESIKEIVTNPINAPYKIISYLFIKISPTILFIRAVSYLFYLLCCISLYFVLRHWHNVQVAGLTTLAFATNSVVLATGRLGTTLITVFAWYIFAAMLLWQLHSRSNKLVPVLVLISLAGLLYTPGAVWFFMIICTVFFNQVKKFFKNIKRNAVLLGSLIFLIAITPLVISFISDTDLLNKWLLVPDVINFGDIPRNILRVPSAYIYRMQVEPLINVGRLPIFDLATGILFLIGLNAYSRKISLDRTKVMLGSALVGVIIGALGNEVIAAIMLLPFAFSVVAAGIEYLQDIWYRVFPKNPFAQSFGILLLTCVVLFGSYYQLTRFLVVWPQTPETKEVYRYPRKIGVEL